MKFRINGEMKIGSETRAFTKEIEAKTEAHAKEIIYSLFGAQNGVKRSNVKIAEITEVA